MNWRQEKDLLGLCSEQDSGGGMIGFEKFAENYIGTLEEKNYIINIAGILRIRNNSHSTRVYSLDWYNSLQELIDETYTNKPC